MITLDTNLLARLLLRDDAAQYEKSRRLLAQADDFTAPVTVMLELVWVLEVNDCRPDEIVRAVELLMGLPNFRPERPDALRRALHWYAQGLDIADALHLALSAASARLSTFDKAFARRSRRLGVSPEVVAL